MPGYTVNLTVAVVGSDPGAALNDFERRLNLLDEAAADAGIVFDVVRIVDTLGRNVTPARERR